MKRALMALLVAFVAVGCVEDQSEIIPAFDPDDPYLQPFEECDPEAAVFAPQGFEGVGCVPIDNDACIACEDGLNSRMYAFRNVDGCRWEVFDLRTFDGSGEEEQEAFTTQYVEFVKELDSTPPCQP